VAVMTCTAFESDLMVQRWAASRVSNVCQQAKLR
jgi:hypothetical protein